MALSRHAVGEPRQGYPNDGRTLSADIELLKQKVTAKSDNVEALALGKACTAIHSGVESLLKTLRTRLWKLADLHINDGAVKLHMGKLKKNSRILQKAVHYAVCTDRNKQTDYPRLDRVCDVLRATIEFPASYFEKDAIGSEIIDTVEATFRDKGKGKVVQVKNRFIEGRYPNIQTYTGKGDDLSATLRKEIIAYVSKGVFGRDGFYRDLQLLVQLGGDKWRFGDGIDLSHVMLEIQLVPSRLYEAKTHRNPRGVTGHDMYKVCRAIMEHCEYAVFTSDGKEAPRLADAADYYEAPAPRAWQAFTEMAHSMWELYRKALKDFSPTVATAIDDSKWYQANK